MNFLTENRIEQYADLLTRIEEITTASEQTGDSLNPSVPALQAEYEKLQTQKESVEIFKKSWYNKCVIPIVQKTKWGIAMCPIYLKRKKYLEVEN